MAKLENGTFGSEQMGLFQSEGYLIIENVFEPFEFDPFALSWPLPSTEGPRS